MLKSSVTVVTLFHALYIFFKFFVPTVRQRSDERNNQSDCCGYQCDGEVDLSCH